MSEKQEPRLPMPGEYVRMIGKLVGIEEIPPPPPPKPVLDYIFEETEARIELRINGRSIKTYSTLNNFYGEGTCVEGAIEEARTLNRELGDSDAEFVVSKTTMLRRMRPRKDSRPNFYSREHVDFEPLEYGSSHGLPDDKEEVVWSSKNEQPETAEADRC